MITEAEERQAAYDRAYAGLPHRGTWNASTRRAALAGYAEGLVARAARTDLTSFIVVERNINTDRLRATAAASQAAADHLAASIVAKGYAYAAVVPVSASTHGDVMADRVPTGTLAAMVDFITGLDHAADEAEDHSGLDDERRSMGLTAL